MSSKHVQQASFLLPTPPESVSDGDGDGDSDNESGSLTFTRAAASPWIPVPPRRGSPSLSWPLVSPRQLSTPTSPSSPRDVFPPSPSYPPQVTYAYPRGRSSMFYNSEPFWLALYFLFNLGLTLYNKLVLVRFPFPYTLTALHAFSGTIGSYLAMEFGYFSPARLTVRESLLLTVFSFLYTINIVVSNASLQLVTVPFHQVVRAATPLFIISLSYLLLSYSLSRTKLLSLVPVILGVALATYGDYYFTTWGLVLTLLGTVLAALKTIATNLLQTGRSLSSSSLVSRSTRFSRLLPSRPIKLYPLDLLLRMSPLAFIQCVLYASLSGELERVRAFGATQMDSRKAIALAINGAMAFGLNVVSFTANSKVGPLSITVAANVKQVLTILLAVGIFHLNITSTNAIGIVLTLLGGAWYAALEYREKKRRMASHSPLITVVQ